MTKPQEVCTETSVPVLERIKGITHVVKVPVPFFRVFTQESNPQALVETSVCPLGFGCSLTFIR